MVPDSPLYATQRPQPCCVGFSPEALPQQPTRLAPVPPVGECPHLWTCDSGVLRCYHCGWTYRAVLARGQTLEEGPPPAPAASRHP